MLRELCSNKAHQAMHCTEACLQSKGPAAHLAGCVRRAPAPLAALCPCCCRMLLLLLAPGSRRHLAPRQHRQKTPRHVGGILVYRHVIEVVRDRLGRLAQRLQAGSAGTEWRGLSDV